MDRNERFNQGDAIRRQVMGDAHVDRSWAQSSDTLKFYLQQGTELAWGTIWTRPGLDLRARSIATLSVLVTLGRTSEIPGHVRGALNNGLTPDEIRELFLHIGTYAGFPAGLEAARIADDVLNEPR